MSTIPDLLATLKLRGDLVSLDAPGCMRQITSLIRTRGTDDLLAVNRNPPLPQHAVQDAFADMPNAQAHGQGLRYCISAAAVCPKICPLHCAATGPSTTVHKGARM